MGVSHRANRIASLFCINNVKDIFIKITKNKVNKIRLDTLLVDRKLVESRNKSKTLILAGKVLVDEKLQTKVGTLVNQESKIVIKKLPRFVSRAGDKLNGALKDFNIDPNNYTCFDAGASTGGFTDCLLQQGAKKIYAYDVGTNQLVWKIRTNPKVVVKEKFNLRYLLQKITPKESQELLGNINLIVADLSFISLTLILPQLFPLLKNNTKNEAESKLLCLIKPQFELKKDEIQKGGVIKSVSLQQKAIKKICDFVEKEKLGKLIGINASQTKGTTGNQEYFACFKKY